MTIALVCRPSPAFANAASTHPDAVSIDPALARQQQLARDLGCGEASTRAKTELGGVGVRT
jgi:hypothetical protein